jgi:hypothetical protein
MSKWYILYEDTTPIGLSNEGDPEKAVNTIREQLMGQPHGIISHKTLDESTDSEVIRAGIIAQMTMLTQIFGLLTQGRSMLHSMRPQ